MNREIKYRVWDKKNKVFLNSRQDDYEYMLEGVFCAQLSCVRRFLGEYDGIYSETVIQQYTGIKDKNGAPIYEGDILNWESNSMSHRLGECKRTRVVSVKWHEKSASFIAEANKHDLLYTPMYWKMDTNDFNGKPFIKEVIGNVFENKELLENEI